MTLNDPYLRFQGHSILWRWISQKRYEIHSFNWILIGTYTRPAQQCHFEWPSYLEWLIEIFNDTKRRGGLSATAELLVLNNNNNNNNKHDNVYGAVIMAEPLRELGALKMQDQKMQDRLWIRRTVDVRYNEQTRKVTIVTRVTPHRAERGLPIRRPRKKTSAEQRCSSACCVPATSTTAGSTHGCSSCVLSVTASWVGRYWQNKFTSVSNFSLLLTLWRHLWRHRKSPLLSLLPLRHRGP